MAYASASGSEHALRARRLRIQSKLTPGPSPTPPPSPDPGSEAVLVLEFILHCYYSVLEFLLAMLEGRRAHPGPSGPSALARTQYPEGPELRAEKTDGPLRRPESSSSGCYLQTTTPQAEQASL